MILRQRQAKYRFQTGRRVGCWVRSGRGLKAPEPVGSSTDPSRSCPRKRSCRSRLAVDGGCKVVECRRRERRSAQTIRNVGMRYVNRTTPCASHKERSVRKCACIIGDRDGRFCTMYAVTELSVMSMTCGGMRTEYCRPYISARNLS